MHSGDVMNVSTLHSVSVIPLNIWFTEKGLTESTFQMLVMLKLIQKTF